MNKISAILLVTFSWLMVKFLFAGSMTGAILSGIIGYVVLYRLVNAWGDSMAAKQKVQLK